MSNKKYGLRRLFIWIYRILLITSVFLGSIVFILGFSFESNISKNQLTVRNAVKEQLIVDEIHTLTDKSEKPRFLDKQEAEANVELTQEIDAELPPNVVNTVNVPEPLTILLVGEDSRPGEKSTSNMDTMLIAQVDPQAAQIRLLSVPRDTQVEISEYGKGKINGAARLGKGLKSVETLLEKVSGQKIDGYVSTNFAGFKDIIDIMGGINLTVEKDMFYVTGDKQDGIINLKKGTQRLNGNQALQYVRFRQDALADITRAGRQQAVLKAIAKEFGQIKTLPKLPWLIPQVYRNVKTDLSIGQVWSLVNLLTHFNSIEVVSQTLPGNFIIEKGISYWKVDLDESYEVLHDFFTKGKTVAVFSSNANTIQDPFEQNTVINGSAETHNKQELINNLKRQVQLPQSENTTRQDNLSELPKFEYEITSGAP